MPFSILSNSIKSSSFRSSKLFLIRVVVIFSLSAPGAAKFENPLALSNKSGFSVDATVISSFIKRPTL